jgi:hypothetical protein
MRDKTAHCFEAALFAAAALRINGWPPLILDLVAVRDSDHVIAVYKIGGCWGAVALSNFSGIRFREPIYRTVRELAISYFEDYFNLEGEKTLRQYSRPVNLSRFVSMGLMTAEEDVWPSPNISSIFRIRRSFIRTGACMWTNGSLTLEWWGIGNNGAVNAALQNGY